jgi:polyribonucleotide 5'-hydroxyl-kinase
MEVEPVKQEEWEIIHLPREHEYRITVDCDKTIELKVESGTAELFGIELSPFNVYKFSGCKIAIFTWKECVLKLRGRQAKQKYEVDWNFDELPHFKYLNLHFYLNKLREEAMIENKIGPKVLVTGSAVSGKTTLCKILLNYATKNGWKPIFCDLDYMHNDIFMKGSIGAAVLDIPFPEDFLELNKLVFFYGYGDKSHQKQEKKLFDKLVTRLAECVDLKFEDDLKKHLTKLGTPSKLGDISSATEFQEIPLFLTKKICNSGAVINTGPIEMENFDSVKNMVESFNVDLVIVIDNEGMFRYLSGELQNRKVIKLVQKVSDGSIDEKIRAERENMKFRHYFNGPADDLLRSKITFNFSEVKLCKLSVSWATSEVLPAGTIADSELRLTFVKPDKMRKMVLGVSSLTKVDDEKPITKDELMKHPIAFLIYVTLVDSDRGQIQVLHPVSDELMKASRYWIYSDISTDL